MVFSFSLSSLVAFDENAVLFGVGHRMGVGKIKMPHKGEALEADIEMINLISIIQLEKVAVSSTLPLLFQNDRQRNIPI